MHGASPMAMSCMDTGGKLGAADLRGASHSQEGLEVAFGTETKGDVWPPKARLEALSLDTQTR